MLFTLRRGSAVLYRGDSLQAALASSRAAPKPLTFFSVCSGIEAASVAWHPLGWECVGVAEIEKFPCAVLAHHYPDVPNHGDFTNIDTSMLPAVDILCGGTPCQAFSVAGARRSLDDARGNLTLAFVGLAHALNPRNVVWENVPGVLSTKDNAFGCFLAGLVGADDALPPPNGKRWPNAGMVDGPKGRAAWRVLDAQYFGLAQRRKRVILVADFGNGADPAALLFEPESVRRDSPPSREAGQGVATAVAPSLTASGRGVERTGDTRGQDPVVAVLRGHSDYGNGVPSIRAEVQAVQTVSAVRRLTPRECERLQGLPDDYTRIPYRNKPAALCPDGPRYKSLGNSWAVPKFRWLGERIQRLMPR